MRYRGINININLDEFYHLNVTGMLGKMYSGNHPQLQISAMFQVIELY